MPMLNFSCQLLSSMQPALYIYKVGCFHNTNSNPHFFLIVITKRQPRCIWRILQNIVNVEKVHMVCVLLCYIVFRCWSIFPISTTVDRGSMKKPWRILIKRSDEHLGTHNRRQKTQRTNVPIWWHFIWSWQAIIVYRVSVWVNLNMM